MTEGDAAGTELFQPRKLAAQLLGFVVGLALLGWCIALALQNEEGWTRIRSASPWLVLALAGCSVASFSLNGALFWLVIRPLHRLRFGDLQILNVTVGLLNYTPIRLGLIARVAYHVRIDRIPLLEVGAWLAAIGYTLAVAFGACLTSTLVRPQFDLVWLALLLGQVGLAGVITSAFMGHPLVTRYGRGMDQMLRVPTCLWGALALRLVDISAFIGRMACAAAILGLDLTIQDTALLGLAALAMSLIPFGRVGGKEAAVAFVATQLQSGEGDVAGQMATLALIESAGEAMVAVPFGSVGLIWLRRRWRRGPEPAAGASE